MAVVIGAIAGAVAAGAVAAIPGLGAVIVGTLTVGSVLGAVAGMAVSGIVTSAFADDRDTQRETPVAARRDMGFLVNTASTSEPIPVLYGYRRVGGQNFLKEVGGPANEFLYLGYTVSEGEIAGFDETYLDGTPASDAKFAGMVTLEYHTGSDAQGASDILVNELGGKFTASDIGMGIAYAVVKLRRNADLFPGQPLVQFDVRGRLLYDTRDAGTRFSNNPALAIRDYWTNTRYGRGIPTTAFDDATITSEANHFDGRESVPAAQRLFTADPAGDTLNFEEDELFDNGDGVTVEVGGGSVLPAPLAAATTYYVIRVSPRKIKLATSYANSLARTAIDITDAGSGASLKINHIDQARYTCDGVVDVDNDPLDNLRRLRSSCQSWLFHSGGKYKLACDRAAGVPTFTFNEDNIVGEWQCRKIGKEGRYNRVRADFWDPALEWNRNFALVDSPADRATDGGSILQATLQLDFTTNIYRGRRIAELERRKSRLTLRVGHTCTLQAFKAECADVCYHTHSTPGWTNKRYRVTRVGIGGTDEIEVDLTEYGDIWTGLSPGAAFTLPVRTNLPDPSTYAAPRVTGLEIFNQGQNTVYLGRDCKLAWRDVLAVNALEFGSEPYGAGSNSRDPWSRYIVTIKNTDGTERRSEQVIDPLYVYTYEKNAEDGLRLDPVSGAPARAWEAFVYARTRFGKVSAISARLAVSNPAPVDLLSWSLLRNTDGFVFKYTRPTDTDWVGIKIWASTSSGFTPSDSNLVYDGVDTAAGVRGLLSNTTYYYRSALRDAFGLGNTIAEASVTTLRRVDSIEDGPASTSVSIYETQYGGGQVLTFAEFANYPSVAAKLTIKHSGVISFAGVTALRVRFRAYGVVADGTSAGTITTTVSGGNYAVVGVGTDFTQLAVYDIVLTAKGGQIYRVEGVTDATHMTVSAQGAGVHTNGEVSGAAFTSYRAGGSDSYFGSFPYQATVLPLSGATFVAESAISTPVNADYTKLLIVVIGIITNGSPATTSSYAAINGQWIIGA